MPDLALSKEPPVVFPLFSPDLQVSLFAFLPPNPGDWCCFLGGEELKGVSMATPGPAP